MRNPKPYRQHKPPAQIRYERSHPTVSFRLSQELKGRLEEVLEGKSFADFVKERLGVREREKESLEKARKDGYNDGYAKGYEEAMEEFGIYSTCSICGKRTLINNVEAKRELERYMEAQGWYHTGCARRRSEYI